jgi:hypothetical protein
MTLSADLDIFSSGFAACPKKRFSGIWFPAAGPIQADDALAAAPVPPARSLARHYFQDTHLDIDQGGALRANPFSVESPIIFIDYWVRSNYGPVTMPNRLADPPETARSTALRMVPAKATGRFNSSSASHCPTGGWSAGLAGKLCFEPDTPHRRAVGGVDRPPILRTQTSGRFCCQALRNAVPVASCILNEHSGSLRMQDALKVALEHNVRLLVHAWFRDA